MKTILKFGVVVVSTSALAFSSYIVGCKVKQAWKAKKEELLDEDATVVLYGSDLTSKALQEEREQSLKEPPEDAEIASEGVVEVYEQENAEVNTKKVDYGTYSAKDKMVEKDAEEESDGVVDIAEMYSKPPVLVDAPFERPDTVSTEGMIDVLCDSLEDVFTEDRKKEFKMMTENEVWNEYLNYIRVFVPEDSVRNKLLALYNAPIKLGEFNAQDVALGECIIEDRYNVMGSAGHMIENYGTTIGEVVMYFARLGTFDTDIPTVNILSELLDNVYGLNYSLEENCPPIERHEYTGPNGFGIFGIDVDHANEMSFRQQYFVWIEGKM